MNYLLTHSIEKSAKHFPMKEAFVCFNRSITYQELENHTNQLATLLLEQQVKKGDRVGIYMNRSIESVIAIYGIMKAGAAYVPLDPDAPSDRTEFLLEDCDIKVLITIPAQKKKITSLIDGGTGLKSIIGVEGDWEIPSFTWGNVTDRALEKANVSILEDDLAYIMYTSGSTGVPKGIMHTHRSGLNYAKLSAELYQVNEKDRIGLHAPMHFDISTFGFFTGPYKGATTIIIPEPHTKMPVSLAQLIAKEKLSIWYSVPLALTQMLQSNILSELDLSSLRWTLFGGEVFPVKHLSALMKLWPNCKFSNVYGPAEVNQCTYFTVPETPDESIEIPLGRVWNNTEALILNQEDSIVPKGEVGELLIRTSTMMKGYWNQKELTERSFYKMMFNSTFEKIFYRTGDLVKEDVDGNLLFLGRKDRQVKIRGYRVELDEISSILNRHKEVHESAVFTVKNESGEQSIITAILQKEEGRIDKVEIRNYLKGKLPHFAIPQSILIKKELPRTSNGKIDHLKLGKEALNEGKHDRRVN